MGGLGYFNRISGLIISLCPCVNCCLKWHGSLSGPISTRGLGVTRSIDGDLLPGHWFYWQTQQYWNLRATGNMMIAVEIVELVVSADPVGMDQNHLSVVAQVGSVV